VSGSLRFIAMERKLLSPPQQKQYWTSYLWLGAIALVMLFPIVWLFSTALKSPDENIFRILERPTLTNFLRVWHSVPFGRYLWNSIVVSSITVILNLLLCALAAYPLARMDFKGKKLIFWAITGTLMIPFQVTLIPLYVLAVQLGLKNTYLGLIFPCVVSPFGIFLLRQAFQGVPKELEEAALMDGCHSLEIWWCIMLPAIRPALITLAIFTFVSAWGDFLWPLLMVDKPELYTLPLGVATLESAFSQDWRLITAGSVLALFPLLLLFVWVQKYIIPSDVVTGIKG